MKIIVSNVLDQVEMFNSASTLLMYVSKLKKANSPFILKDIDKQRSWAGSVSGFPECSQECNESNKLYIYIYNKRL